MSDFSASGRNLRHLLRLGLLSGFCWILPVSAQENSGEQDWRFLADVYLMFVNIDGEAGIGDLPAVPIDADPGDIFSKLQLGGMLYLEAGIDHWAITSDLVFMNLQQDITAGRLISTGEVTAKQFVWEAAGLYRILPYCEVGVGGRLNSITTDLEAERNVLPAVSEPISGHHSKTFYDPILVSRLSTTIMNRWLGQLRGDIGGFGIGSDLTWQLQIYCGYRFSDLFRLIAGYRILSIDYDKGSYGHRFIFDVNEFGPVIRLGFSF